MEFEGVHKGDTLEVSGPDTEGEYHITVNELRINNFGDLYMSRAALTDLHAFIGELLAGEGVA
jgi:hypothetical protein